MSRQALAELIEVEVDEGTYRTGTDPRARFSPSVRMLKAACDGLASLLLFTGSIAHTDVREDVRARLVKIGTPEHVVDAVIGQLASRHVLSSVALTPQQQFDHITSLLGSPPNYRDGRL